MTKSTEDRSTSSIGKALDTRELNSLIKFAMKLGVPNVSHLDKFRRIGGK